MRQEPDQQSNEDSAEEADRASRDLGGQIEKARRVLREYRDKIGGRSDNDNA